MAKKLKN